jgi:zinc/manganese transport system ATP-binding protein
LPAIDRVLYLGRGQAALGRVDEVITSATLSRLYGAEIEVVRLQGRIFVMSGGLDLEHSAHLHEHEHGHTHEHTHDHGHAHAHQNDDVHG